MIPFAAINNDSFALKFMVNRDERIVTKIVGWSMPEGSLNGYFHVVNTYETHRRFCVFRVENNEEIQMHRRDFLKHGMAATALAGGTQSLLLVGANSVGDSTARSLSISIRLSDDRAMICLGDRRLADYYAYSSLKSALRKSPCFAFMAGPATGQSLVSAIPQPWRQTSGVSFTCDRVACGDVNQDAHFGCGPRRLVMIASQGLSLGTCTTTSVEFYDHCSWYQPNQYPILSDRRRYRLSLISETAYMLDCEYQLTPQTDLAVQPSGQSLFSLCAANDLAVSGGGQILNSKGQRFVHEISGGQANWLTFFGKRKQPTAERDTQPGVVEGIAVLSPDNAIAGCRWLAREYGLLVPNSLHYLDTTWQLRQGKTYRFVYRIVAYSGPPDPVMLHRLGGGKEKGMSEKGMSEKEAADIRV